MRIPATVVPGGMTVNISPLDIRKHEFKKTFRGADPDEVMAFLDMVSIELENLVRENSLLKEKLSATESQLKKYHDIEGTLRETLLSAQRAREETIDTAKKHADVIIREAEVKAAAIIEEGRNELTRLRRSFVEMKVHKESYLAKIRAMINAQLDVLKAIDFPEEKALNKYESDSDEDESYTDTSRQVKNQNISMETDQEDSGDLGNPLDDPAFYGDEGDRS